MRLQKLLLCIGLYVVAMSCTENKGTNPVTFQASFAGARLDSTKQIKNNRYIAYINPAFEPVNESPYYAFAVLGKNDGQIEVELDYGKYKHRYLPKLSTDGKTWKPLAENKITVDTVNGTATLKLDVSHKKLYVAAQEIETANDTYTWADSLLGNHPQLKKKAVGKTVLGRDNFCLLNESPENKNAIVFIARQHPPETPGGTIGFKAFFETVFSDTNVANRFRDHFNVYAFPLLNPDGADLGHWRHNANGIDLNRDWVDFTQPETQTVRSFFEKKVDIGQNIRFAIDFHTSYSGPYVLVLDSLNRDKSKNIIPNWIQNIENRSAFQVEARPRSQQLPYCYNYFINRFGCEAVTYEEGDEVERSLIKKRAKVYANELMRTLLNKMDANEFDD